MPLRCRRLEVQLHLLNLHGVELPQHAPEVGPRVALRNAGPPPRTAHLAACSLGATATGQLQLCLPRGRGIQQCLDGARRCIAIYLVSIPSPLPRPVCDVCATERASEMPVSAAAAAALVAMVAVAAGSLPNNTDACLGQHRVTHTETQTQTQAHRHRHTDTDRDTERD
jgi:hypothetical protein